MFGVLFRTELFDRHSRIYAYPRLVVVEQKSVAGCKRVHHRCHQCLRQLRRRVGWELYVPTEFVKYVYDAIIAVGSEFNLRHCGYHALIGGLEY